MIKKCVSIINVFILLFLPICAFARFKSNSEIVDLINDVAKKTNFSIQSISDKIFIEKLNELNSKHPAAFSELELIDFISNTLMLNISSNTQEKAKELRDQRDWLIAKLRSYKITGMCFAFDPNLACVFETQNPDIWVSFKDSCGNVKMRKYKIKINTFGFKLEASIKLDFIFLVNTDLDFYHSDKIIELGVGIDSNIAFGGGLALTYAPFKNFSGGLFMVSIPLLFSFPSLSLVTGGSLTPVM